MNAQCNTESEHHQKRSCSAGPPAVRQFRNSLEETLVFQRVFSSRVRFISNLHVASSRPAAQFSILLRDRGKKDLPLRSQAPHRKGVTRAARVLADSTRVNGPVPAESALCVLFKLYLGVFQLIDVSLGLESTPNQTASQGQIIGLKTQIQLFGDLHFIAVEACLLLLIFCRSHAMI